MSIHWAVPRVNCSKSDNGHTCVWNISRSFSPIYNWLYSFSFLLISYTALLCPSLKFRVYHRSHQTISNISEGVRGKTPRHPLRNMLNFRNFLWKNGLFLAGKMCNTWEFFLIFWVVLKIWTSLPSGGFIAFKLQRHRPSPEKVLRRYRIRFFNPYCIWLRVDRLSHPIWLACSC